jgi:hypothetical protein
MIVYPAVQFKTVESHALAANAHLENVRPDFRVKPVPVHPKVTRRVAKPDKSGEKLL